jgi:Protein of unknown function (DUF2961)
MSSIEAFLELPPQPVPDRAVSVAPVPAGERFTAAELDGPGCIRHVWLVPRNMRRAVNASRDLILRIYFDGEGVPAVEAPVGDFFGVMHGEGWYPVDTHLLSVLPWCGYNCYFPMPFARSARVELEAGPAREALHLQVDWHRYPDATVQTPYRFCARWRRELPTESYGPQYLMLDANGPGRLVGFSYGVRLFDDEDRWSHGGAENIYLDGSGEYPAYIRGVGGEDTFGLGYGGNQTVPLTHHYASTPYYTQEDIGDARPAPRVVGHRFFEHDALLFRESLHVRFGCMANDICSTVYWYQPLPVRPFFRLPPFAALRQQTRQGLRDAAAIPLPRGAYDEPLPDSGSWMLCGPFALQEGAATELPPEAAFDPGASYDGGHAEGSGWQSPGSVARGRDRARWVRYDAVRGFVDFNHVFQPVVRGAGVFGEGWAYARAVLRVPAATQARLRLSWDDALALRLNEGAMEPLGEHHAFRTREIAVSLREGENVLLLKQSNTRGSNHGGWVFNFQALAADGTRLFPRAEA